MLTLRRHRAPIATAGGSQSRTDGRGPGGTAARVLESGPMRTLLLTLHVVAAIFVIGPLAALANQTARA